MTEGHSHEGHEHCDHDHGADGHDAGHAHGPTMKAYMAVFGALVVFTLVSFVANLGVRQGVLSPYAAFAIIMLVAVCKATLVAVYFMHLILDWKRVYVMIVPALILGPMLVVVLLPDIVLAWRAAGQ